MWIEKAAFAGWAAPEWLSHSDVGPLQSSPHYHPQFSLFLPVHAVICVTVQLGISLHHDPPYCRSIDDLDGLVLSPNLVGTDPDFTQQNCFPSSTVQAPDMSPTLPEPSSIHALRWLCLVNVKYNTNHSGVKNFSFDLPDSRASVRPESAKLSSTSKPAPPAPTASPPLSPCRPAECAMNRGCLCCQGRS